MAGCNPRTSSYRERLEELGQSSGVGLRAIRAIPCSTGFDGRDYVHAESPRASRSPGFTEWSRRAFSYHIA